MGYNDAFLLDFPFAPFREITFGPITFLAKNSVNAKAPRREDRKERQQW